MTGMVPDLSEGRKQIHEAVTGGAALSRFQAMLEAQGVAREAAMQLCSAHTDYFKVLRKSEHRLELRSGAEGKKLDPLMNAWSIGFIRVLMLRTNKSRHLNPEVSVQLQSELLRVLIRIIDLWQVLWPTLTSNSDLLLFRKFRESSEADQWLTKQSITSVSSYRNSSGHQRFSYSWGSS